MEVISWQKSAVAMDVALECMCPGKQTFLFKAKGPLNLPWDRWFSTLDAHWDSLRGALPGDPTLTTESWTSGIGPPGTSLVRRHWLS